MNIPESRISLLQQVPFFGGIREDIIAFILQSSRTIRVQMGRRFVKEGDSARAMYILEEGRVAVVKRSKDKDYLLGKLDPGDCFGEMSLMDCMPRSASVYALEDSSAIEILPSTLHQISSSDLEQFTLIEMNMGREVCRRLRAADEKIFEQSVLAEVENDMLIVPDEDK